MNAEQAGHEAPPFTGHILVVSDSLCVLRRLSDAMIILFDRDTNECHLLRDASGLAEFLNDEECRAVQLALHEVSHKLLH